MPNKSKVKAARRQSITHTACESCRGKRSKCDGKKPCRRCSTRHLPCEYTTRSWASKSSLRDEADNYCELIKRRERVLDAIADPVIGDVALQYLRQHGVEEVYDKLDVLTGGDCNKRTSQEDSIATGETSIGAGPQYGLHTGHSKELCSNYTNCGCEACAQVSPAMNSTPQVSPSSQNSFGSSSFDSSSLGSNSIPINPTSPNQLTPANITINQADGFMMSDKVALDPSLSCGSSMPLGLMDSTAYPPCTNDVAWQSLGRPDLLYYDIANPPGEIDGMAGPLYGTALNTDEHGTPAF